MKKFIISLLSIWALGACTGDFEEMNFDPNNPSKTATPYLLTNAQKGIADQLYSAAFSAWQGMQYAQYWASNQYTNESRYQERPEVNNAAWNALYAGPLTDLQEIIYLNTQFPSEYGIYGDNSNQIAIAKILRVYTFQVITDCWGDIPYSQALDPVNFRLPVFDTQEDVYAGLLTEIDEAIELIDTDASGINAGDIIYGGDMDKWLKFANSIKLKLGIRIADVDAATAGPAIQEAVASGVFTSNSDNAVFQYLAAQPNNNPLNNNRIGRVDFAVSKSFVDALVTLNDPRLSKMADEVVNSPGTYVGIANGLTEAAAGAIPIDDISQPSGANAMAQDMIPPDGTILAPTFPGILIDYAQVEFILAEAAARNIGGVTGAAGHYNAAVTASMNFWGVTGSGVTNYLAANPYNAGNFRQSIGVQKWIALYGQGTEGWIEFRRLDFTGVLTPVVSPLVVLATPAGVPVRTAYPTNESTLNGANYNVALGRLGVENREDELGVKVWWDVN